MTLKRSPYGNRLFSGTLYTEVSVSFLSALALEVTQGRCGCLLHPGHSVIRVSHMM